MTYFMGIDVSTTGAKAVLVNDARQVAASLPVGYPLQMPHALWAEQNPPDWWQATSAAIRRLLHDTGVDRDDVAAVGLTGHMFGLVALDAAGDPLRPCIMWNDQRAAAECEQITKTIGPERLIDLTANAMIPGYVAPKLLWLRQHEPATYSKIAHLLVAKDYIRYQLTGDLATDVTDAPGTGLFDVANRRWSQDMLDALAIRPEWLPTVFESVEITGAVSQRAAAETGLRAGTPVVAGAGDQPAQAVGNGIVEPGTASITVGTSGVIFVATSAPVRHPQGLLHAFCHAVADTWCLMGVVLSAGASLRWFRDTLGKMETSVGEWIDADPYELLCKSAAQVPVGSEGLLFLPYLTGERTPHVDPQARGAWIGLTARHRRQHLIRAILEGVAFALRDALDMVQASFPVTGNMLISGGAARSPLWRQIHSDILGRELVTVSASEGAGLGAAILAAVGVGHYPSVSAACAHLVCQQSKTEPIDAHIARYDEMYEVYRGLYHTLKPANDLLSNLGHQLRPD